MKKNDALTASCSTMYARLEFEPRPFGSYEEGGNLDGCPILFSSNGHGSIYLYILPVPLEEGF
jgi:hypothetical protein